MSGHDITRNGSAEPLRREAYRDLLCEAGEVSDAALDRVRHLSDRFPCDLPDAVISQLERTHAMPDERRGVVRLDGRLDPVAVRTGPPPEPPLTAAVVDRSAAGLRVWLKRAVEPGEIIGVRHPGWGPGAGWYLAEVRHCRPCPGGWSVGCEFVGERPPAG